MVTISILDIVEDTTVDGPGFRTTVYSAGCPNCCPGCHNPHSWDIANGHEVDVEEILKVILADQFADVTFSGGDPFLQPKQCASIASCAKHNGLNVWAYSGFTYEQLIAFDNSDINKFLDNIDVLVDGKFDISKKSLDCKYRGSTNQRLIDVQKTKKTGRVVLWEDPFDNIRITHNPFM